MIHPHKLQQASLKVLLSASHNIQSIYIHKQTCCCMLSVESFQFAMWNCPTPKITSNTWRYQIPYNGLSMCANKDTIQNNNRTLWYDHLLMQLVWYFDLYKTWIDIWPYMDIQWKEATRLCTVAIQCVNTVLEIYPNGLTHMFQ